MIGSAHWLLCFLYVYVSLCTFIYVFLIYVYVTYTVCISVVCFSNVCFTMYVLQKNVCFCYVFACVSIMCKPCT